MSRSQSREDLEPMRGAGSLNRLRGETAILVLGMHRSGTSCVTGCLEEAGAFLGTVNRAAAHNRKGNLENQAAMRLNDAVLQENGGSWDRPPRAIRWSDEHRRRRNHILEELAGPSLFALKDPRLILVLDGWVEVLTDWTPVVTFRHPLAVARSLQRRDGLSIERGLRLWYEYNRRLVRLLERKPGPVVSFDLPFPRYERRLRVALQRIGLDPPVRFSFPDDSLRRERGDPRMSLSGDALDIYLHLRRLACQ